MTSSRLTIKSLNEEIKKLRQKIEEIDLLKMKVKDLETALEGVRKQNKNVDLKLHSKTKHNTLSVNCDFCEMVFSKKCDLELHLETEHNIEKEFKCDKCEMSFVMRWRLQKHMGIHEQKTISKVKFCHYFNNDVECPFAMLGCMFKHEIAPLCHYQERCSKKLCQFKHTNLVQKKLFACEKCETITSSDDALKKHMNDVHTGKTIEDNDDEEIFDSYVKNNFPKLFDYYLENDRYFPCYFCDYSSKSQILKTIEDEMTTHLDKKHRDIIESFDPCNSEYEDWIHEEYFQFFCPDK